MNLAADGWLSYVNVDGGLRRVYLGGSVRVGSTASNQRLVLLAARNTIETVNLLVREGLGWKLAIQRDTGARTACEAEGRIAFVTPEGISVLGPDEEESFVEATDVGSCSVSESTLLAVVLKGVSGVTTTTVTSYSLLTLRPNWTRAVDGLTVPSLSPTSGQTILVSQGEGLLLGPLGHVDRRFPGVADARFVDSGELVLLSLDGKLRWVAV